MSRNVLTMVVLCVVFTVTGLAGGWFAAKQRSTGSGHGGHGGEGDHSGHDHEETGGAKKPALSPQAMRNLGITVAEVQSTTFVRSQAVPATVMDVPGAAQPLYAPIGGRVVEIHVQPGAVVPAGTPVVTLARDALPTLSHTSTDQPIQPVDEEFHRAVVEFRKAKLGVDIFRTELKRIQEFTETGTQGDLPVIPRKNLIDLRYDLARAEQDLESSERELHRHGCTDEQIAQIAEGKVVSVVSPIQAPMVQGVVDWDLHSLEVKLGQKIEPGQVLAVLRNPRRLLLRSEPVGSEVAAVLAALTQTAEVTATPQVAGTGPALAGLKLSYVTSDGEEHGAVGYLNVVNEPLREDGEGTAKTRTWKLRPGQRYLLRVPVEKMENVYVLPSGAVTDDGPDKVVFLQDGDSFKTAKVVVRYQDHEVVVLDADHSDIFPGDAAVQQGAFGLGLALKAGSGAVDPHAGHNH